MKRSFKLLLISTLVIVMSLAVFTGCDFLRDAGDIFDEIGDFFGDIFGGSSKYEECELHNWILNYTDSPNCTYEGYEYYYCQDCGETKQETLPRTPHIEATESGYPATCSEYGMTDRIYCEHCGVTLQESEFISPKEHTIVTLDAVAPTCTENGLTEGKKCSDCGEIFEYQNTVYATHTPETVKGYEATCTDNGLSDGVVCSVCNEILESQWVIYADHVYEYISYVNPTCTEDGHTDGSKCSRCGEFIDEPEVLPGGHIEYVSNYGSDASCYEDGWTEIISCERCGETLRGGEVIPAAHKEVEIIPGYAATCKESGLTDGSVCTVCGETITEQTTLEKLSHTAVNVPGYAATCSSNGLTDGVICSVCKTPLTTQHTITAIGHIFDSNGNCTGCSLEATADLIYNEVYDALTSDTVAYKVAGLVDDSVVTEVVIPDNYNGLPVIGIEEYAFDGNVYITIVVIPASIVEVGDYAFNGCTSLEEIDCANFAQTNTWSYNWYGDSYAIKISAPIFGDKTPYELYLEAMNKVNHNIDRFVMSNNSATYITDGITTYKALEIDTIQKQYYNDSYVYQEETDYMSVPNNVTTAEQYYVGEYIYIPQYQQMYYFSLEAYYDIMTINRSDMPEFTEKYFKAVKFRRNIDGTMELTIEMDEELLRSLIEDVSGIGNVDWNILACSYKYTFDYNGNLSTMISDLAYKIAGNPQYTFNAVSTITLSEVGTFSGINAPYGYQDVTYYLENQCSNGHHVVECPAVEPNCFSNGWTAYSYCDRCFHEIDGMEIIYAGHNYENGECTDCGNFENLYTSQGLAYSFNGEGYIVIGIGNCTDTTVVIPQQIYGRPVVAVSADAFKNTNVYNIQIGSTYFQVDYFYGCDDTSVYWN